ncbi:MAG: leucine-rich repeat domain-containing protein [Candidatus Odinarchaeota archaeon]
MDPEKIYQKLKSELIDESEAIELLIPFLESSEDISLRIRCLEILSKINLKDLKTFKVLENLLISDENEMIRLIAAKLITNSFPDKSFKSLKWVIKNDESPILLKEIKNLIEHFNYSKILLEEYHNRLKDIASIYKIDSEELQILLDLNIKLNGQNLYQIDSIFSFIYETNFMCTIKKGHINELSMSLYDELPTSIGCLSKLEHLNLSCNYLKELPNSLSYLKFLKTLDLSWNNFVYFPEVIKKVQSIEIIDLSYNCVKDLPPWINLLKNLTFLNLENNAIKKIPDSIRNLKKLKFFYY